jgi:4-hydroxy-4-methyl-2-oxoglutarate aldolase
MHKFKSVRSETLPSASADAPPLSPEVLDGIRQYDTCTVANAIEQFGVRLRNEGFTRPGLRPVTGGFPAILGYAATCRVRSSDPPMIGHSYLQRTDWWGPITRLPLPRIAVIEDLDAGPGAGSVVGEVHAAILKAFGCGAVITNGSVRDVPGVSRMDFVMFAPSIAVSHAYAHIVDFGKSVEIMGLRIESGDLVYADCHGVVSIPLEVAGRIPAAAEKIRANEQRIISVCRAPDFSTDKLLEAINNAS